MHALRHDLFTYMVATPFSMNTFKNDKARGHLQQSQQAKTDDFKQKTAERQPPHHLQHAWLEAQSKRSVDCKGAAAQCVSAV